MRRWREEAEREVEIEQMCVGYRSAAAEGEDVAAGGGEGVDSDGRQSVQLGPQSNCALGVRDGNQDEPQCGACGKHRKLIFLQGKRARETCNWGANSIPRRRITSKRPDLYKHYTAGTVENAEDVTRDDAGGHLLMVTDDST